MAPILLQGSFDIMCEFHCQHRCFFSPTPTISCSAAAGGSAVVQSGVSQLMAHRKQEPHVGLTPSLANYLNPKLTEHVSGWLVDPTEVQVCWVFFLHFENDYRFFFFFSGQQII